MANARTTAALAAVGGSAGTLALGLDALPPLDVNVGGRVFCTARATLLRDAHSLLARAVLHEQPLHFDRDAHVFRYVLNYLRDGDSAVLPTSESDRAALLHEARFYELLGLVALLEQASASPAGESPLESFLTARPSSDGYFYLADVRVAQLWPELLALSVLDASAVLAFRFLESDSPTSSALDLAVVALVAQSDAAPPAVVSLAHARLALTARAVARIQLSALSELCAFVEFWWRQAEAGEYPQLCAAVSRRDWRASGLLGFMHAQS